jgi:hypothetical protein
LHWAVQCLTLGSGSDIRIPDIPGWVLELRWLGVCVLRAQACLTNSSGAPTLVSHIHGCSPTYPGMAMLGDWASGHPVDLRYWRENTPTCAVPCWERICDAMSQNTHFHVLFVDCVGIWHWHRWRLNRRWPPHRSNFIFLVCVFHRNTPSTALSQNLQSLG